MRIVVLSLLLGVITEGILIWRNLLLYTNAVSHPIVGGGVIGLLVGLIWGATTPLRTKSVIAAGVIGVITIASFDGIVYGELAFRGRALVLYALGSLISGSLAFLGTKVSQRVLTKQPES